jgi:hypothetical protein
MANDLPQETPAADSAPAGDAGFPTLSTEAAESRIDGLIVRLERLKAEPIWSHDIEDPELQKNLHIFGRLITSAAGLCERARRSDAKATPRARLLPRIAELQRRIVLPDDKPLTLPLLLGHRFALEQLLVELGDETYLRTRAVELYAEPEGTNVTWAVLFKSKPPLFIDGDSSLPPSALESTRAMVAQLLAAKEAQDLTFRTRRDLKTRMLSRRAVPFVAVFAVIFGLAIARFGNVSGGTMLLSVTAAVTGAVLGRLLKLRDDVTRGAQVREFLPLFFGQVVVGLVTGLFVSVAADQVAILNVSSPKQLATLSFAAGFSEAAFLGLVSKITGESSAKAPGPTDRPPAGK